MHITRAAIENIRIIPRFTFELGKSEQKPGWHVILGDNGAGKSTLIRALAITLIGEQNAAALRQDWSSWVGTAARGGSIALSLAADKSKYDKWSGKGRQADKPITPRLSLQRESLFKLRSSQGRVRLSARPSFSGSYAKRTVWGSGAGWFSAAFGPFRRFRGGDREYDKLYYSHPRLAAHLSAFGEDVALSEALAWVKDSQFKALEGRSDEQSLIEKLLDFINKSELLPHGARLAGVTSDGVMVENGAGTEVAIEEMSDGYRSILAMTFEIMRAMEASFGSEAFLKAIDTSSNTVNLPGIILIDEIDSHLHPAWQSRIGQWFTERFPMIQFIVTTHSPIICQAAERGSIWRLASPGSDEVSGRVRGREYDRLVYGNVLEAYSTEYFGTGVTRSTASKDQMTRLAMLNRKGLRGKLSKQEEEERVRLRQAMPSAATNV